MGIVCLANRGVIPGGYFLFSGRGITVFSFLNLRRALRILRVVITLGHKLIYEQISVVLAPFSSRAPILRISAKYSLTSRADTL